MINRYIIWGFQLFLKILFILLLKIPFNDEAGHIRKRNVVLKRPILRDQVGAIAQAVFCCTNQHLYSVIIRVRWTLNMKESCQKQLLLHHVLNSLRIQHKFARNGLDSNSPAPFAPVKITKKPGSFFFLCSKVLCPNWVSTPRLESSYIPLVANSAD